jgi:hypothetical protein
VTSAFDFDGSWFGFRERERERERVTEACFERERESGRTVVSREREWKDGGLKASGFERECMG